MNLCGNRIGLREDLFLIAGPCAIESEAQALRIAKELSVIREKLGIFVIFKGSFEKGNRTSFRSFQGIGIDKGLRILEKVKECFELPVLTDVHESFQVDIVSKVVDIIQVPAFLSRQTTIINACAMSGLPVNIKKAQFLSPKEMYFVIEKAAEAAASVGLSTDRFLICERGTSFGYNDLIADMRSLEVMKEFGCPIVFDATHSAQAPGSNEGQSGGSRKMTGPLARAAVAVGVSGIFIETHPEPETAKSDAAIVWPLSELYPLIKSLVEIDRVIKEQLKHIS